MIPPTNRNSRTATPVCRQGYPILADLQGKDRGLAILRRFGTLNAKNALYLQAELLRLEEQLATVEAADAASVNDNTRKRLTCARDLMEAGPTDPHKAKVLEIQKKLYEYNKVLIQQKKIFGFPEPSQYEHWILQQHLTSPKGGKDLLSPPESGIWKNGTRDLVALSSQGQDNDKFTRFVAEALDPAFGGKVREGSKSSRLVKITQSFTILMASLLPTASIFALHYIRSEVFRLVFVMIFSAVFSLCLKVFTSAKRIEIFTSAVALASVQVVFIGTSGGGGNNV